jgi:hypothetical protein
MFPRMTNEERREANRLRSERWRRAHGIGPRKPAQKPWLAEGISRSTWYRRGNRIIVDRAKAEKDVKAGRPPKNHDNVMNLGQGNSRAYTLRRLARDRPDLSRAEAFTRQLQAELAEVARCQAVMTAIIGEMEQEMIATGRVLPWLR